MAVTEQELPFRTVAVIDDSERDAESLRIELIAIGLEPVEIAIEDRELDDVVNEVRERADAAVCDHYLKQHKRVGFSGAEAVALLTSAQVPTCLITMYPMDGDVDIRRYRGLIPSLLLRADAGVDELAAALLRSYEEVHSGRSRDRVPYRTAISVERVSDEAGEPVADVLVSGWQQDETVRFPLRIIPNDLQPRDPSDLEGTILFAEVNLGAERSLDLFFQNFEAAPPSSLGSELIAEAPQLDWGTIENKA